MASEPELHVVELFASLGISAADIPSDIQGRIELASDAVIAKDDRYSTRDIAERFGRDPEELCVVFAEIGIRVFDVDDILFSEEDLGLLGFVTAAAEHLLIDNEGDEILNVIGSAIETVAEAAVASHVQGPERRLETDTDGIHLNKQMAELGLDLGGILPMVFRHHLRQAALRQRRVQNHDHRELVEMSVGFVDLVGFTSLSQSLASKDLVDFVRDFERAAHNAARRHNTRIAKLIGDEVMFVAESATDAAGFATDLITTFRTENVVPRGGIAQGSIITLHGDYFGPIVNLAARLVGEAVPAEVLVTKPVASELDGHATAAGRRMLKGFPDPVEVWSVAT